MKYILVLIVAIVPTFGMFFLSFQAVGYGEEKLTEPATAITHIKNNREYLNDVQEQIWKLEQQLSKLIKQGRTNPPHDKIIYICGCGSDYEMLEGGMYRCTNRDNHRKMIDKSVYSLLQGQLCELELEVMKLRKILAITEKEIKIQMNLKDCGCQE